MAAAGAAVALYFSYKRATAAPGSEASLDVPSTPSTVHFKDAHQAPNTYLESLYFFAEALRYGTTLLYAVSPFNPLGKVKPAWSWHRYMYSESLGRWRTADLLIGLAYLARREGQEHPVADIAATAQPIGRVGHADVLEQETVLVRIACSIAFSCCQTHHRLNRANLVPARADIAQQNLLPDHCHLAPAI